MYERQLAADVGRIEREAAVAIDEQYIERDPVERSAGVVIPDTVDDHAVPSDD